MKRVTLYLDEEDLYIIEEGSKFFNSKVSFIAGKLIELLNSNDMDYLDSVKNLQHCSKEITRLQIKLNPELVDRLKRKYVFTSLNWLIRAAIRY